VEWAANIEGYFLAKTQVRDPKMDQLRDEVLFFTDAGI